MILIWKGAGILVAVIWFVSILAGDELAAALFGPQASPGIHNLTVEWLAAVLTLALALLLRLQRVTGIDPQTGAEVTVRPDHSLFWIPVIVWPAIFLALGIFAYYEAPAPSPPVLEVTPAAAAKAREAAAAKSLPRSWRVRIEAYWPKGLESPAYSIQAVTGLDRARDYEFESAGVKVVVLKRQVDMLRGARLDYVEKNGEEGFLVNNPNFEGERVEKWRRDLELESPPDAK
jgi:Fe-S cluster assembly iron-binding protein IscA